MLFTDIKHLYIVSNGTLRLTLVSCMDSTAIFVSKQFILQYSMITIHRHPICEKAYRETFKILNLFTVIFTSRPFLKTAGGIVLGSVAVSAVSAISADVLPYISVAIKASFLKFGMCNICKNNIAKMFLDLKKKLNCSFDRRFLNFFVKNRLRAESQKPLGGFSQNLHCRYI